MATESLENLLDTETSSPPAESAPAPTQSDAASQTGVNDDTAAPPAVDAHAERSGAMVPRRALEDERRKRQEIEKQLADVSGWIQQQRQQGQPQQQQPMPAMGPAPPDMYSDPEGYAHWVTQQAMQRAELVTLNRELHRSEARARKAHGDEAVERALQAAHQAGIIGKFLTADDPYGELIGWHGDYELARNPQSLREQIRQELMAELGGQGDGRAAPAARPAQRAPVPRSLASTASAQPRDQNGRFTGPTPLEDIIG